MTNPNTAAELLTSDLMKIDDWAKKWLVTFQPITKTCLFKYTENFTTKKMKIFR